MQKLLSLVLALSAVTGELSAQRLLGVHADSSGSALTLRIPNALSMIVEPSTGAFHFRYGSTSTGTWIYTGIPAGTYEMWHSAPGFEPAGPWALTNPVAYSASGDVWASACLQPNANLPRLKFQTPTTTGDVGIGTTLDLELDGQAFSAMWLFVSRVPILPPLPLVGLGPLFAFDLLAPTPFYTLDLGTTDGNGQLFRSVPIPRDPTLVNGVLVLQSLEATPALALQLANVLAIRFV